MAATNKEADKGQLRGPISDIPKAYDSDSEMDLYDLWEKSGKFNPDNIKTGKKPFVITQPPPNANDKLHIGHTCGYSFQDCMGRYNRMKGHPTLLLPGKDHAGIQTEAVFTRVLREKGIDKWKLGRDEFYKQCYAYCMENSKYAREQERRIGLSSDWSREKFTLDPKLTEIVYETFYKMLEDKLIFRGKYIVNQCTNCRTALANVDTEHRLKKGIFAYIRYPIVGVTGKYVTVATTRPETMLGDTAVAVHPNDKRYTDLVGSMVELPLTGRTIPIIADNSVDMTVGTACLKVTPAHSSVDFKIAQKHKLPMLNVIAAEGKMSEEAPEKYRGMTALECREAVLADLSEAGLLEKVEDIEHDVLVCERCGSDIEQILSNQWFVEVHGLAEQAIDVLDRGDTKVHPSSQEKVLRHWFKHIEPWCISRQLWWGHRIPIWYCGGRELYDWLTDHQGSGIEDYERETKRTAAGCGTIIPGINSPKKCPKCGRDRLEPETDIFDTWFSSGQWPYSTLGGVGAPDYEKYYPTDVMETMRDIIFFWVARMMMLGLYRTGKTPFHTVYLHGMILAADGTKMSKKHRNGVYPDDVFRQFGADATRLWYFTDTLPGQNTPFREEKLKGNRNFVNKIWNASRYVMMQVEDMSGKEREQLGTQISQKISTVATSNDPWDVETARISGEVTRYLDAYRFNLAVEAIREFFWHTFCDTWIEETKKLAQEPDKKQNALARLIAILAVQMKLVHPFMPFVSERIWQTLRDLDLLPGESDLLMMAEWPVPEGKHPGK